MKMAMAAPYIDKLCAKGLNPRELGEFAGGFFRDARTVNGSLVVSFGASILLL